MKTYQLILALLMSTLLLLGCSKPEREPGAVSGTPSTIEKTADQPSEIARRAGEISQALVEKTVDKTIEVTGMTPEKVEKAKAAMTKTTDRAVIETEVLVAKTEAAAKKVSQQVAEKTAAVEKAAVEKSTAALDKAETALEKATGTSTPAAPAAKTAPAPKAPETVTLENKKGKITLPHKKHAATFACALCHGDATSGPFDLGQEKGHTLCKGCHQEKGGPTACTGCHEKKAVKAVEGC